MKKTKPIVSILLTFCILLCAIPIGNVSSFFAACLQTITQTANALDLFDATPTDATMSDATPSDATPADALPMDPFDYVDTSKGTPYHINVRSTEHSADNVANFDGYASVSYYRKTVTEADKKMILSYWEQWNKNLPHPYQSFSEYIAEYGYETEEDWYSYFGNLSFMALFSKEGAIVMPYTEGATWYIVNDGIICRNNNAGYAAVGGLKKYTHANGYFTLQGERLFDDEYQFGRVFSNGIAFVRRAVKANFQYTQWGETYDKEVNAYLIDTNGNIVLDLSDNFAITVGGPNYDGAIDGLPWYFDSFCDWYSEGLFNFGCPVLLNENVQNAVERGSGKVSWKATGPKFCGYFDIKGNIVIPQSFADCKPFYGGLAAVQDADITTIEAPETQPVDDVPGSAKPIKTDDYPKTTIVAKKWGFIDKDGNTVIPFEYDFAERFYGDYAVVSKDEKYGIINRNNEIIVPFSYKKMSSHISDGLFVCEDEEGIKIKTLDETTVFTLRKDAYSDYSDYIDGVLYYVCDHKLYSVTINRDIIPGDVDGDGKVTSADARLALRASVGLEKYKKDSAPYIAADVTEDGNITPEDARYILRASVKLEDLSKLKKQQQDPDS